MGRRRRIRYRISDLLLLVGLVGFGIEFRSAVLSGLYGMMIVCFAGFVAIAAVLLLQPKLGSHRCPYCGRYGIERVGDDGLYHCDDCDTICARSGHDFRILSSPADERLWALRFLPKLQTLRQEMRPGTGNDDESNASRVDHFSAK